jgi:hypothetical protein
MAEITRKRTGELLRKLFEILIQHPEGLRAATALERLSRWGRMARKLTDKTGRTDGHPSKGGVRVRPA